MNRLKGITMLALVAALMLALPGYAIYKSDVPVVMEDSITLSASKTILVLGVLDLSVPGIPTTELAVVHAQIEAQLASDPLQTRVDIAINSLGGRNTQASETLFAYMDYLATRGISIRCTVAGMAASLAAILYSHCTERYATSSSTIMVHAARINGVRPFNATEGQEIVNQLRALDQSIWAKFKSLIDDEDYWDENFAAERQIPAVELATMYPETFGIVREILLQP